MVFFSNQKTHSHTAFHPTSKSPQDLPEVSSVSFSTIFQRAPILHFLFKITCWVHLPFSYEETLFPNSTYASSRQSLEAKTNDANKHKVSQISMSEVGSGLDWLEWHKIERLVKKSVHSQTLLSQSVIKTKMSNHKNEMKHQCTLHQAKHNVKTRHCPNSSNRSNGEKCPHQENDKDFLGLLGKSTTNSKIYDSSMVFCAESSKLEAMK